MRPRSTASIALAVAVAIALPLAAQSDVTLQQHGESFAVVVSTATGPVTVRETTSPVTDIDVIPVAGTSVVAVTWNELEFSGPQAFYAISLNGTSFHDARATSYELKLKYAHFDPLQGSPSVPAHLDAAGGGELWIVQYRTQGLEVYRDALREMGAEIHLHLQNHANIVSMDAGTAAAVAGLPFVRAIVSYHPAYRLDAQLLQEQVQGFAAQPTQRVNILALRRGLVGQNPIAARVRALGGTVDAMDPWTYRMQATLDLGQISEIARMDEVQWIDVWGAPEDDMALARTFHGADVLENNLGLDGTGVRGEVLDSGCLTTHQEFGAHPLIPHGATVVGSHGTSTTGQVFASGVDAGARGMLPDGQGVTAYYSGLSGGSRYNHSAELVNPNLNYRCVFQTNSWGSPRTLSYNSASQEMDLILFDLENLTICQSQSNAGDQMSRPQAWAKNIVAVGGVKHQNTLSSADDNWTFGGSIGPAQDGRVKPEYGSFYDNIRTTSSSGTTSYTNSFGGTSGATPIVAGSFGLFYEAWHQGAFNNPTSASVFDSAPHNTTARAFMIASATQWNWLGGGSNGDIDRDKQGWGHPDLNTLYDYRNSVYYVDETDVITNLQTSIHSVTVNPGEPLLKASLVWRDNPGTVSSTAHLINDLDLRVTSPAGTVYRGNWGLTNNVLGAAGESLWSTPGGSADTRNSAENVFIQNPQPGNWLIEVIASDLNQDIHPQTGALDADYALCVIGVQQGPPPIIFSMDMTNTGTNLTIEVNNVPTGTAQGYCLFSEDASGPYGAGSLFGIYPTPLSIASFTLPAVPGSLLHWTYPGGAFFPDAPANVAGLPAALFPIDGVAVAIGAGFTLEGVTAVERVN